MPRKRRFFVEGVPSHIVQRGNSRQTTFFDEADYRTYLSMLGRAADTCDCQIHAYVLMRNHVHLLATPMQGGSISQMMQSVGRHFVPYVNAKYDRSGTLWDGRFKASLIGDERYLFACYRYIELNPVRAGIVGEPGQYAWSSYHYNADGVRDALITPRTEYLSLADSDAERHRTYRAMVEQSSDPLTDTIRVCAKSGTPMGSESFIDSLERNLSMPVRSERRGRPKKGV